MTIQVAAVARRFQYNGMTLPDIPGLSVDAVRDVYAAQYPELTSAEIVHGDIVRGKQDITFRRAVGTKG